VARRVQFDSASPSYRWWAWRDANNATWTDNYLLLHGQWLYVLYHTR
jgi:hypothetical protein